MWVRQDIYCLTDCLTTRTAPTAPVNLSVVKLGVSLGKPLILIGFLAIFVKTSIPSTSTGSFLEDMVPFGIVTEAAPMHPTRGHDLYNSPYVNGIPMKFHRLPLATPEGCRLQTEMRTPPTRQRNDPPRTVRGLSFAELYLSPLLRLLPAHTSFHFTPRVFNVQLAFGNTARGNYQEAVGSSFAGWQPERHFCCKHSMCPDWQSDLFSASGMDPFPAATSGTSGSDLLKQKLNPHFYSATSCGEDVACRESNCADMQRQPSQKLAPG